MRSKKKYLQKQIDELYQKVYQPSRSYVDLRAIVLDDKVYEAVIVGSTDGLDDNPEWSWIMASGEAPATLEVDARDIARGRARLWSAAFASCDASGPGLRL